MTITRVVQCVSLFVFVLWLILTPPPYIFAGAELLESSDWETLFDDYAASVLSARRVSGMVIVVVDARQTLFSKGYGLANPEQRRTFHPENTVVSAASVAKTFTALATLQLYERGHIRLDDDVNQHLRAFQVPDLAGRPVTIRQLLTHTDGFEARIIADAIPPGEPFPPLRQAAQQNMPRRILPPGKQLTYGSYASNLLGVLIEDVSGQPFEQYVETNILLPLQMTRTTFRQPLAETLLRDLAPGCSFENGDFVALPLIASRMAPQGGLYTTAADMGRFLQMLLNRGALGNARIAQSATIDLMLQQQFTDDPRLPGVTLGLFEVVHRGQRLLVRDGDGLGTRSRLVLIPAAGIGLFISYTSDDDTVREEVVSLFLQHRFPAPVPTASTLRERTPLSELEGTYRPLQWDQSTPGKMTLLFANVIRVQRDPARPDLLRIESVGMGEALGGFEGVSLWREREPLLFEIVQRDHVMLGETILFKRDASGRVAYLHSASKYHGAFVKMAEHEAPEVQWLWLGVCALTLTSALIWIPVLLFRALFRARRERAEPLAIVARVLGVLVSVLFAVLILQAFGQLFAFGSVAGIPPLAFGIHAETAFVLNALWLPTVLTVGLVGFTVLVWMRGWWGLLSRVHYTLVSLAAVGLVIWLKNWNLLGY